MVSPIAPFPGFSGDQNGPDFVQRRRFSREVIQHAVWLYFRVTLSLRDVEEMLAQRGIDVFYEAIRCRTMKFDPRIAAKLRRRNAPPSPRWHLASISTRRSP